MSRGWHLNRRDGEKEALAAAKLEKLIEKELVNRLKSGNCTEDMLNVNEEIWKKVLDQRARAERGEVEKEEIRLESGDVEFVSDDEGVIMSGDEEFNCGWVKTGRWGRVCFDIESEKEKVNGKRKLSVNSNDERRKLARIEVKYEEEWENQPLRE